FDLPAAFFLQEFNLVRDRGGAAERVDRTNFSRQFIGKRRLCVMTTGLDPVEVRTNRALNAVLRTRDVVAEEVSAPKVHHPDADNVALHLIERCLDRVTHVATVYAIPLND